MKSKNELSKDMPFDKTSLVYFMSNKKNFHELLTKQILYAIIINNKY